MTRRLEAKPESSKRWAAWASAAPTAVQLCDVRGASASFSAKRRAAAGAVDDRPVDHHHLVVRAGPFGVAERDAPVLARQDGVDDALVGERLDIAAALEFGFDLVDRARDVDRQHELQVDRRSAALADVAAANAAREPTSAVRRFMPVSCAGRASIAPRARQTKAGKQKRRRKPSGVSVVTVGHGLLIVVEPALARLVITLAPRTVGRAAAGDAAAAG